MLPLLDRRDIEKPTDGNGLVLEAWAQGYMIGSLVIMAALTIANMRRGVLLHKLILLELVLGMFHGTFIFTSPPVYGWYLSTTAIFLNMSWSLHNVISWMKTKPFLSKKWSLVYIITVLMAQPYWVLEIYANFTYFNNINDLFVSTRPWEALCRDPWWIFSTVNLFYNIGHTYHLPILTVVRLSPRFAVLLTAMLLSICFLIIDIVAVTQAFHGALPDGLNPFWKLSFVFKCLTDSIVLDDFKTALDKLQRYKLRRDGVRSLEDEESDYKQTSYAARDSTAVRTWPSASNDPLTEDILERGPSYAADHGGNMTFAEMLQPSNRRESMASQKGTRAQHVENWEDMNLPAFQNNDLRPTTARNLPS